MFHMILHFNQMMTESIENLKIFIYKAAEITRNDNISPKLHGNRDERINQRLKLLSNKVVWQLLIF